MEKVDFILTWVDGSDPEWHAEKQKFEGNIVDDPVDDANAENRYRPDTELLRYWFRAVEKYAPWVNKIHFVTCGQKPDWLIECHPKLAFVNHKDFIPSSYLPTFNANAIEMNFHRIEGLSEQYVYFNDDFFLTRPVEDTFFFKGGAPVLMTNLQYFKSIGYNNWSRLLFNDYCIVNNSFDIGKSIWKNREKWFNIKELGLKNAGINFLCYGVNRTIPVHLYGHVALPHLKSSLQEIWDRWPDVMNQSCYHKFRTDDQVNQWLLCAWNQARGSFYPSHRNRVGKMFQLSPNNVEEVSDAIRNQRYPQICINDSLSNTEPARCTAEISKAFQSILPDKSSFEKD